MESTVVENEGQVLSQLCELSPLNEDTQLPRTETSNGSSELAKEDNKKTEDDNKEKKRITPTQIAFTEENIYAVMHLIGQHIKKIESELNKMPDELKTMIGFTNKNLEEMKKEIAHSVTTEKKNHKQLVTTLQKLIDEQFGGSESESEDESDSDFVAKRRRRK